MISYLIGIDYKRASLVQREEAYRLRHKMAEHCRQANPGKSAVLTTCNRIEVYGVASNRSEAAVFAKSFKDTFKGPLKNAYILYGNDSVFRHGLRLTCGLESQVRGEPQIMRQLETWFGRSDFPIHLEEMWSLIIQAAKDIRKKSGLDRGVVDIADLVFGDLKTHLAFGKSAEVIIIGTGKIAALIADKKPKFAHTVFVARKKHSRAKELAGLAGGDLLSYEEFPGRLISADAIISATYSPHYILTAHSFLEVAKVRKRLLYIYDVAVPRDVAPEVDEIPFAVIKDIGDLTDRFYKGSRDIARRLESASELAEGITFAYKESKDVKDYTAWYKAQPACNNTGRRDQAALAAV